MTCVFCDIVEEDSNNQVLKTYHHGDYDKVVVFEPFNPCHEGHLLFVHSEHTDMLNDSFPTRDRKIVGDIMDSIQSYSNNNEIDDYNVIINRGKNADQTIMHLHVHFIPRKAKGEIEMPWTNKDKKVEEGVVAGDHGGDPIAIASGESSGNAVNAGASTGKRKKTKLKRSKIKNVVLEFKNNQE